MKVTDKEHAKNVYTIKGAYRGYELTELCLLANSLAEVEDWAMSRFIIYSIELLGHPKEIIITNEP